MILEIDCMDVIMYKYFHVAPQALDTTDYFMVKIFEGIKNNFQAELKVNLFILLPTFTRTNISVDCVVL